MRLKSTKKIFAFIAVVTLLLCVAACGDTEAPAESSGTAATDGTTTVVPTEETTIAEAESTVEDWGVQDDYVALTENGSVSIYIKMPFNPGRQHGGALVAAQADASLVIVDGQDIIADDVTVESIDEVFPAYFDSASNALWDYHGTRGDNFVFEITNQEMVTINDYEMCKYTGNLTYTYEGNPLSSKWVAYATQLKTNGAYVYWMVLDFTADQSLEETIADHAYKMALSLEEG